jgi:hypothetical protein
MIKNLFTLSGIIVLSLLLAGVSLAAPLTLVNPPHDPGGANLVPVDDYFQWTAVTGAAYYVLAITQFTQAEDNIPPSVCAGGICSFAFLDLSIGNIEYASFYQWTVTAYNAAGNPIGAADSYYVFYSETEPGTCNNNGICDPGENAASCPNDCGGGPGPGPGPGGPISLFNPLKANTLWEAIDALTNFLLLLAFVVGPILIIYAAFLLLFARGDPRQVEKAKTIIYWTLIALTIILFAKGIPSLVKGLLGG